MLKLYLSDQSIRPDCEELSKRPFHDGQKVDGFGQAKARESWTIQHDFFQSLFSYIQWILLSELLLCPTFVEIFDFSRSGWHINTSYKALVNIPEKERPCHPIIGKNQRTSYEARTTYHTVCGFTKWHSPPAERGYRHKNP
jgi:hypothetical protein